METLRMVLVRFGPYLAALAGILVAAVANGMETGIYRLNRIRLRLRAEAGDRRARTLAGLLGDVRGLIVVCLLGYNVGVYVTTAFVTTLVESAGWARGPVGVEVPHGRRPALAGVVSHEARGLGLRAEEASLVGGTGTIVLRRYDEVTCDIPWDKPRGFL